MDAESFYERLLLKASQEIEPDSVMIIGPLYSGSFEENISRFRDYTETLHKKCNVFSQLDYLETELVNAPFDFEKKFEIFYKGLIRHKNISRLYVIPGWKESKGTLTELRYAKEIGKSIVYL